MNAPNILRVLQDAQLAQNAGDFTNALKFYEQFFDDSLTEDPEAMYGLRLTTCLDGWASLADSFPGAKNRLQEKQSEMLLAYNDFKVPERFHDFLQISRRLNQQDEAIEAFINLHLQNPKSAAKLTKYVWQELVDHPEWQLCNELLQEPSMKLDELFAIFDEASRLKDVDPAFNSLEFEQHTVDQLHSNLQALVGVLRNGDRKGDIDALERQFFQGIQNRDNATLNKRVHAQGAFLFAAH